MVPRAAYAPALDQPIDKRAVVVAAIGIDGEDFAARAHHQHILIADMADQLAMREVGKRDTLAEIRAARLRLLLGGLILRGLILRGLILRGLILRHENLLDRRRAKAVPPCCAEPRATDRG
jgi:hypothetical protein